MRNTLLGTTAILVASIAVASAQNMPNERSGGAAPQMQERQQGGDRVQKQEKVQKQERRHDGVNRQAQRGPQAMPDESRQGTPSRDRARGKADEGKQGQRKQSQDRARGRADDGKQGQTRQSQDRTRGESGRAVDQGSRERASQQRDRDQQGRQDPQRRQSQQADRQREQRADRTESAVKLTTEQRTRIRRDVLARRDAPRVDRVNFSVNVGVVVPTRVRVVAMPATLIDIHPEWRGYSYFVVRDEIVIVDRNRHIVDVVVLGPTEAALDHRGAVAALGPDEIREVQIVLIRRGYDLEADGVFGPQTRDALIQFQRQEGLAASGEIDRRTVVALGVSIESIN